MIRLFQHDCISGTLAFKSRLIGNGFDNDVISKTIFLVQLFKVSVHCTLNTQFLNLANYYQLYITSHLDIFLYHHITSHHKFNYIYRWSWLVLECKLNYM